MDNQEYILVYGIIIYYCILYTGICVYENRESVMRWIKHIWKKIREWIGAFYASVKHSYSEIWVKYGTKETLRDIMKIVCFAGVFCYLLWCFENVWLSWYIVHIAPYLDLSDALANILLSLFIIGVGLSIWLHTIYKRPLKKERLRAAIIISILFVYYRICDHVFEFKCLSFADTWIAYVDIAFTLYLIYILVLWCLDKHHAKYIDSKFPHEEAFFYYDAPIGPKDIDRLRFNGAVLQITNKFTSLTRSHSWSIGIVGPWGSGKTSFINLIKHVLLEDKYLLISFNPRFASKPSKIQEMALETLSDEIRPYNSGIRSLMRRYIQALQLDSANSWVQFFLSWFKSTYDIDSLKNELNEALEKLPKQVVFVFDDFDRLTREEIIEVLKLIDGNANFKNIIYIAAYDREHVQKLLDPTAVYDNSSYIEKYFGIEIHVPLSINEDVLNYLKAEMEYVLPTTIVSNKLTLSGTHVLNKHAQLFKRSILTLRDAKRYLNLLQTDLLVIKTPDLSNEDFMLLTLLKFLNVNVYESICYTPAKWLSISNSFLIYDDAKHAKEVQEVREIMAALFPNSGSKSNMPGKIRNSDTFNGYFVKSVNFKDTVQSSEVFDNTITTTELHNKIVLLCGSEVSRAKFIDYLEKFGKLYIEDKDTLLHLVEIVLFTNRLIGGTTSVPFIDWIFKTSSYITLHEQGLIDKVYQEITAYIIRFYSNNEPWTVGDVLALGGIVVDMYDDDTNRNKYIISRQKIEPLLRRKHEEMCERFKKTHRSEDFDIAMMIYCVCVESIDPETHKIKLDQICSMRMNNLIKSNPAPYFSNFVRLGGMSSAPDVNHVACEPFWNQIFSTTKEFRKLIYNTKYDLTPNINKVRNFWRLYNANGYEMIPFCHQGNVQEIIDNDFREQMAYLSQLKTLKKQLQNLPYVQGKDKQKKIVDDTLKDLESNPLDIALKDNIYKLCKSFVF